MKVPVARQIFITGAHGLLGATLVLRLRESGYTVVATDKAELDITDAAAVHEFAARYSRFDWVIHTAALTDVALAERDRALAYAVNVSGTRNVRDLAMATGARLIHISTASVFSGDEGHYTETDLPYPKNFYNLTKWLSEEVVLEYPKSLVLRLNLIGIHPGGSRGKNFFEWLVDSIRANKDMTLLTDVRINALSNWTIADVILRLMESSTPRRVFHIGSQDVLSKADIGAFVIKKLGHYRGRIMRKSIDEFPGGALRPKEMWLNADIIQRELGITMPAMESEIDLILRRAKLVI